MGDRTAAPRWMPVAVVALLAIHVSLALWAAAGESVTADEILHVTHGWFVDRHGDHRVQPENGSLPQRLHGLAALLTAAPPPILENNEYWRTSSGSVISHQFFYETGHDHFPMLMLARAFNTLFSVGTGLCVFWWARRLAGSFAGLVALGFYALEPNLLAHAALATSDLAAAFFLLGSATLFWRQLEAPTAGRILASALIFGFACVTKFSAVLLLPVFAVLLVVRIARDGSRRRRHWWWRTPVICSGHAVGALIIIWIFYGFRYAGFSPELPPADHYNAPWDTVLPYIGWHGRIVGLCREWHLLPEAFLYGYAWVIHSAQARGAFLAGDYSIFGWASFFPLAFLWKTTLAMLVGLLLAMPPLVRRWQMDRHLVAADLVSAAPLLVFFTVYWSFSVASHLNIGHRHILPTYPVLLILLGAGLASAGWPHAFRFALPLTLVIAHAASSLRVAPHFLAFFNTPAGGPANGYRLLVDSSLDWGQDLAGLDRWLRQHNSSSESVFLSYFGSGEPNYYGIHAVRLPFVNGFKFVHPWYEPAAGIYCISATMLQQVYSPVRGKWTSAFEQEYQTLRSLAPSLRAFLTEPTAQSQLLKTANAAQWETAWKRYDTLRFARLCHYLRSREPEAMIGYSILVYRLTQAEVDTALHGDLRALVEGVGWR